jgi:hypothetical protein
MKKETKKGIGELKKIKIKEQQMNRWEKEGDDGTRTSLCAEMESSRYVVIVN